MDKRVRFSFLAVMAIFLLSGCDGGKAEVKSGATILGSSLSQPSGETATSLTPSSETSTAPEETSSTTTSNPKTTSGDVSTGGSTKTSGSTSKPTSSSTAPSTPTSLAVDASCSVQFDFTGLGTGSSTAMDAKAVGAIFADASYLTKGANPITGVTKATYIYQADPTQGPKVKGLKLGKSDGGAELTLASSIDISKVALTLYVWNPDKPARFATVSVGGVSIKLDKDSLNKVETFSFAATKSLTITTDQYCVMTGLGIY